MRVARIAGLLSVLAWLSIPAAAQEPRWDVGVGFARTSCMNGAQGQLVAQRTTHFALVGEFGASFGADCDTTRPRYRDFLFQGGARWSWNPGTKTSVFVHGMGGLLHSTAGRYTSSYLSGGLRVPVNEPELTITYLAMTYGGGVTRMFTPRVGLWVQVDTLVGVPDQSEWEGVSMFGRATAGLTLAAGRPFSPRPEQPVRPRRVSSRAGQPVSRERWDASAVFGLTADPQSGELEEEPQAAYGIAIGHYVTRHLKADGRAMLPVRTSNWTYEDLPVPGLPGGGYQITDISLERQSTAVGATWQFRDNAFFHPYVSAGVSIDREQEHRHRDQREQVGYYGAYPGVAVRYTVTALDERRTSVEFRPYAGGGAKFYVTRRLFARAEWLWGRSRLVSAAGGLDF